MPTLKEAPTLSPTEVRMIRQIQEWQNDNISSSCGVRTDTSHESDQSFLPSELMNLIDKPKLLDTNPLTFIVALRNPDFRKSTGSHAILNPLLAVLGVKTIDDWMQTTGIAEKDNPEETIKQLVDTWFDLSEDYLIIASNIIRAILKSPVDVQVRAIETSQRSGSKIDITTLLNWFDQDFPDGDEDFDEAAIELVEFLHCLDDF